MRKHFTKTILPILRARRYRSLIEIGVARGKTTRLLLEYCKKVDGRLLSIDPAPAFDPPLRLQKHFTLYKDLSLNVLHSIHGYDCALIDGDHNWYTVFHELRMIQRGITDDGIIFLHDVAPPWARRDMYHNLETVPKEFRNPCTYHQKGCWVADRDGGLRNGVLTALEDFCRENPQWTMVILSEHHGLGVISRSRRFRLREGRSAFMRSLVRRIADVGRRGRGRADG